jgi:hypothetical protein
MSKKERDLRKRIRIEMTAALFPDRCAGEYLHQFDRDQINAAVQVTIDFIEEDHA